MNEGIHLDLDTWIVPGQIRKANRYTPAGTEVLISAVAHNTPPPFQAAQNATTVNINISYMLRRQCSAHPTLTPLVPNYHNTICPAQCSPAHTNHCPIRMHRLMTGLNTL